MQLLFIECQTQDLKNKLNELSLLFRKWGQLRLLSPCGFQSRGSALKQGGEDKYLVKELSEKIDE